MFFWPFSFLDYPQKAYHFSLGNPKHLSAQGNHATGNTSELWKNPTPPVFYIALDKKIDKAGRSIFMAPVQNGTCHQNLPDG